MRDNGQFKFYVSDKYYFLYIGRVKKRGKHAQYAYIVRGDYLDDNMRKDIGNLILWMLSDLEKL